MVAYTEPQFSAIVDLERRYVLELQRTQELERLVDAHERRYSLLERSVELAELSLELERSRGTQLEALLRESVQARDKEQRSRQVKRLTAVSVAVAGALVIGVLLR